MKKVQIITSCVNGWFGSPHKMSIFIKCDHIICVRQMNFNTRMMFLIFGIQIICMLFRLIKLLNESTFSILGTLLIGVGGTDVRPSVRTHVRPSRKIPFTFLVLPASEWFDICHFALSRCIVRCKRFSRLTIFYLLFADTLKLCVILCNRIFRRTFLNLHASEWFDIWHFVLSWCIVCFNIFQTWNFLLPVFLYFQSFCNTV